MYSDPGIKGHFWISRRTQKFLHQILFTRDTHVHGCNVRYNVTSPKRINNYFHHLAYWQSSHHAGPLVGGLGGCVWWAVCCCLSVCCEPCSLMLYLCMQPPLYCPPLWYLQLTFTMKQKESVSAESCQGTEPLHNACVWQLSYNISPPWKVSEDACSESIMIWF